MQQDGVILCKGDIFDPIKKGIVKVHPNSKYLCILFQQKNELKIFEIKEHTGDNHILHDLFQDLRDDNYHMKMTGKDLSWVKKVDFDSQNDLLILRGPKKIQVVDFTKSDQRECKIDLNYELKKDKHSDNYEKIYDARLETCECTSDETKYRVQVACKVYGQRQIDIFDVGEHVHERTRKDNIKSMTFLNDNVEHLKVKISNHFRKVLLVNQEENYLLEQDDCAELNHMFEMHPEESSKSLKKQSTLLEEEKTNASQSSVRQLPQLKNKIVRYIYPDEVGNFLLVAHQDYDTHLDILYSEESNFRIQFDYKIEPNIIKILDFQTVKEDDQFCVRVATSRDESFNLNIAKFQLKEEEDFLSKVIENCVYYFDSSSPIQAISAKWPYFAYSGLSKEWLILVNMYEQNTFHRLKMQTGALVLQTYITETNDLFIMSKLQDRYLLQFVDLDASNVLPHDKPNSRKLYDMYRLQDVFSYSIDSVNQQPLLKMHIRGSSWKESIDTNEKLIVVVLHSKSIYYKIVSNRKQTAQEKAALRHIRG